MSISRNVMWGELKGMRKIETVEQMPAEYRQALLKIVYALASTEFASVEQHQPWINRGPTAEDRYCQAQICADEAHQGFVDSRLLRAFGPEGEALAERLLAAKRGEHPLHVFNVAFDSWPDLCGFCFLLDHVAWYHLRAFEDSSFAPFAREMTTMVHEERFHASFGARRIRDLVHDPRYQDLAGAGREEAQRAICKWYPHALDTFGSAQSRVSEAAVRFGIRRWGNEALRGMWKADLDAQIAQIGLAVPDASAGRLIH
jgi:1,2-phenylacetyl-CoA epoxidase catalytic subunit